MSYLIPAPPEPPRCRCGHPETGHADIAVERARFPTRCQADERCYCAEYRTEEDR